MQTSIATVCLSGNFNEKIEAIAAAGFDGFEIFEQDFISYDSSPKEVGARVRDLGLEIFLFQPFRDFECLPPDLRDQALERARHKFDLMNQLGTDLVLVCSTVHPESLGGIDRAAEDFHLLGDLAWQHGVRVGYEALAWGKHINDHRDAWEVVRRCDHPNIGLIVDSFHSLGRDLPTDNLRAVPGDKIFFVQLADAPRIPMDLLYWSRHFRNMPGEGDLDVPGFLGDVLATGYKGPISLEIFNDQFRRANTALIARDGYASLTALADDVLKADGDQTLGLPSLPPRADVAGLEYVEFGNKETAALDQTLSSLGFSKTAQHKSKNVELWQQGQIRLVLNQEREMAQDSGPVREVGLRVDSAKEAIDRARGLGAQTGDDGQYPILPTIETQAGGIFRFIDDSRELRTLWEDEFDFLDQDGDGVGLTQIDHLGQSMAYEEMLSGALFYSSLLNVQRRPLVDIVDPGGLVRSQALEAAHGTCRLTLNGAETSRTFAGRFLAKGRGAQVQHLAFATNDIFKTAEQLLAGGFQPLKVSQNYYDDVAARFGLTQEIRRRLEALHLLYDEDEKGQFFQLYDQPSSQGFFFEVVQRVGGYAGYGAPNAPYRLAAQKRLMAGFVL